MPFHYHARFRRHRQRYRWFSFKSLVRPKQPGIPAPVTLDSRVGFQRVKVWDAIVSEKGQVTIPRELREQLGIRQGTVLEFSVTGGKLIASKQIVSDPFEKWSGRGKLPKGIGSVDEYLTIIRHGDSLQ